MKRAARCWMLVMLIGILQSRSLAQTTEPTTMPATEPTTQADATTEPTTEPISATEPSTQPVPTTEPTTQSVSTTEPSTQPVAATEPTTAPVAVIDLAGMAEGTFLSDRVGRLVRKGAEIDFIFEKDGKQTRAPVLPNLELMRMENAIANDGANVQFHASGRITEYKGRNYILFDNAGLAEPVR